MAYEIVRFRFEGENEVLHTVDTLAEAQEWCHREDTHGDGWFDGYREVPGYGASFHDVNEARAGGMTREEILDVYQHDPGKLYTMLEELDR